MIVGITGFSGVLGRAIYKEFSKIKYIKLVKCKSDVLNKVSIRNWIKNNDLDIIIHLAAIVPIHKFKKSGKFSEKVNYQGTKNIIDSLEFTKKKIFFFFASTSHVYKKSNLKINEYSKINPINNYGYSKYKAEKYIQSKQKKKKYNFCIGRIFSYTSRYQTKDFFLPSMFDKIKKAKSVFSVNFRNEHRDFVHIDDIVSIIKILILKKKSGIYNICSGNKTSLYEIIKKICKKMNKKYIFNFKDKKTVGLLGSNKKIKILHKKKFKNIDFIIEDYFNNFKK